jgi:hypothetical protein
MSADTTRASSTLITPSSARRGPGIPISGSARSGDLWGRPPPAGAGGRIDPSRARLRIVTPTPSGRAATQYELPASGRALLRSTTSGAGWCELSWTARPGRASTPPAGTGATRAAVPSLEDLLLPARPARRRPRREPRRLVSKAVLLRRRSRGRARLTNPVRAASSSAPRRQVGITTQRGDQPEPIRADRTTPNPHSIAKADRTPKWTSTPRRSGRHLAAGRPLSSSQRKLETLRMRPPPCVRGAVVEVDGVAVRGDVYPGGT